MVKAGLKIIIEALGVSYLAKCLPVRKFLCADKKLQLRLVVKVPDVRFGHFTHKFRLF